MRIRSLGGIAICALASVALVAVPGCGSDDDGSGGGARSGDKKLVGFINGGVEPFYNCLAKGLKEGLGDEVELVQLNSDDDVTAEISNGEDLLARNPAVIVLQTVNLKSGTQIVNQANRQDVPVVLTSVDFVRDPSKIGGAVVYNLVKGGTAIGAHLKSLIKAPAKVGVIAGAPGAASDLLVQGFKQGLKGSPAEIVYDQPGMWNPTVAATVAENMVQAQPNLDYVFILNEEMAFGALKALKAAGKDDEIKIITSGGTDAGVKAVEDGTFLSTTDVSPYNVGRLSAEMTLDLVNGRTPQSKVKELGYPVITQDNLADVNPYCAAKGPAR